MTKPIAMRIMLPIKFIVSSFLFAVPAFSQQPALLIHRILANPTGTDSPFELVELVATRSINFTTEPYTVVTADGGNATTNGWASGTTGSYGFQISTGTVQKGDLIYVGGSSLSIDGSDCKLLRTINTLTTAGDGFGSASNGVVGNGGAVADGVAVFNSVASAITVNTVPVDALFYGTSIGAGSTKNFKLPANDLYSGGTYGTTGNTFLGPDPASDDYIYITAGSFNTASNTFVTPRSWGVNQVKPNCANPPTISFISTLPIKFESFSSSKSLNGIKLSWRISDNLELKNFEVLQSADGISYHTITTINAVDNHLLYEYVDISGGNKGLYYKIKATELSGNVTYSLIQKIIYDELNNFILYSNPVKQATDISLSFSVKGVRTLNVYSASGKLQAMIKTAGTEVKIPTTGWGKGLYVLHVINENGTFLSGKLVVE